MIEVRMIRQKLQKKKTAVKRSEVQFLDDALRSFLHFVDTEPLIGDILQRLPTHDLDVKEWLNGLNEYGTYKFPVEDDAKAWLCYEVLKFISKQEDPYQAAVQFHMNGRGLKDSVDIMLQQTIDPFCDYIDEMLIMRESMVTPVDIAGDIQALVNNNAKVESPEAHEYLLQAYADLAQSGTPGKWSGIANTCRQALIAFANAVYKDEYLPTGTDPLKKDDAKNKLKYTLRHIAKGGSNYDAKNTDAKEKIIVNTWDFVVSQLHKKHPSYQDTKLVVLMTYLSLSLFAEPEE